MSSRGRYQRLAVLCLVWAAAVLMFYYARFGELFAFDPKAWEEMGHSLAAVPALWLPLTAGPSAWGLPAFGDAFWRASAAVFGSAAVLCAAQVLGVAVCRLFRWHPDDWREGVLYQTAAGLGVLAYVSLGLALLGLYNRTTIRILLITLLLGGGLVFYLYTERFRWFIVGISPGSRLVARSRAADGVWKAIALAAILIALVGALAPEKEYDALWYHLGFPKLWLGQGRLADLPAEYISLYPMTWEMIFGLGLASGGTIAAKLLHFACLPLTGLLTYQLTLRFFPRASPWLAVAFFVTIPTVLWEATTAYNDLALTLHVGLTVYALLRYVEDRRWQWLLLAALNLGLALATKHLAFLVLVLATGGLALRLWLVERHLWRAVLPALLLGLLALVLALPWYIRSWMATGNPVFPELFGIFGAPPERWDVLTQEELSRFLANFGRPRTTLNLLTLPWDITVHGARYGGALGPMFLVLLPLLALLRRRSRATVWLAAFALLYLALWASPVSSFQMRFLIPITSLFAVLAAEACDRISLVLRTGVIKFARPALHGCVAMLLLLNLPPFTSLHEADRVVWEGWLTHVIHRVPIGVVIGSESQEAYLLRMVPSYASWHYVNTHLPADARVLAFVNNDYLYSKRERLWSHATMARPAVWGAERGQEREALQALRTLGISHILFDKRQLETLKPGALAVAEPSVIANRYDLEYEDRRYSLYRLRESAAPSGSDSKNFYK